MSLTNNKFLRRFTTAILTGVMVVSMAGMNVSAEEVTEDGKVTFNKVLDMKEAVGASVPNITFKYGISAGEAVAATGTTPEIKAGIGCENVSITEADFSYIDSVANDKVTKTVTVDFSGVTFSDAGIYRYVITEEATDTATYPDITDDTNRTRYLDVYVVNDGSDNYEVDYYVLLNTTDVPEDDNYDLTAKSEGFTNSYKTYTLSLDKVVGGTMGEKNREFTFTINFEGPANTTFTYGDNEVTLDGTGKGTATITLADASDPAEITGIPSNVAYTVVETIDKGDGYTTTYTVNEDAGETTVSDTSVSTEKHTMGKADNNVVITNTRDAVNPTGVVMSIMPYALMVALAGVLAFLFLRRRRTNEF